ncbi:probable transcription factor At1g61730 [Phragmites australis]|uniref:probable transcription factor At1g61730 n=1 Tax=Phragmites australis TaxID=29695 RepID=UPI002D774741|nr:probable transcription factor At1g61730 [Phragmites australis]
MAPKRPAAAAASGSASDASDDEADAARRRHSRSRSKTPPPKLHPNAAALSSTPVSAGADFAAASDSDAGGRVPSPRRSDRERSPRLHSDSDAAGRVSSPRRSRERFPRLHSDSDNSAASDDGDRNASPPPRSRRSSRIETSNIRPISSRAIDAPCREVGDSPRHRSRRSHSFRVRHTPEYNKRPPRTWSPEDEITILRALIEYRAKKGLLPGSIQNTSKLHSQICGKLSAMASTTQLGEKVRRLKHKYKLLVTRAKNGRDPNLSTAHERDVYELSQKVWGLKSGGDVGVAGGSHAYEDAGDAESDEEQEIEESDEDMESGWDVHSRTNKKPKVFRFDNGNGNAIVTGGRNRTIHGDGGGRDDAEKGKQMYPYLWEAVEELSKEHPSGPIFRKAFGVLDKSKAQAVEEKLRKFRMSEIRQQLRRMDLLKETVSMVLDVLEGAE